MDKLKAVYVILKQTRRKIVFAQRVPKGSAIRNAELGYIYLDKTAWTKMGEPMAIRIEVTPVLPSEKELGL